MSSGRLGWVRVGSGGYLRDFPEQVNVKGGPGWVRDLVNGNKAQCDGWAWVGSGGYRRVPKSLTRTDRWVWVGQGRYVTYDLQMTRGLGCGG